MPRDFMPELNSKRILVVGGTRGLGAAISTQLARQGACVFANYVRNEEAARQFLDAAHVAGLPVTTHRADVAARPGVESLFEALQGWLGGQPLDAFVFCAATGIHRTVEQLTERHFDWTFALNVRAFLMVVNRLLPLFASPATIVPVSSLGAHRAVPTYALVGASKGALESLARHLAVEFGGRGLRVNILCPGTIQTDVWQVLPNANERLAAAAAKTCRQRLVTLEEVASVAAFLCSDASGGMTGATVVVDGGESLAV